MRNAASQLDSLSWVKRCGLVSGTVLVLLNTTGAFGGQDVSQRARAQLGALLFSDNGFSSPKGDFQSSCSSCHLFDDDPQGLRAYTDFLARSWVPWRSADPRRDGLRNSPTILDAGELPVLHYDGEFQSLEDLVRGTISGRTLGWLPGEEEQAFEQAYRVVLSRPEYRLYFKKAFRVDLQSLSRNEVINLTSRALADFVRSLKTARVSPYDRFVRINSLPTGPATGEEPRAFARRFLARLSALEADARLKLTRGFGTVAVEGLKIFFRAGEDSSAGNCASCHVPPLFTDSSFHNIGITQSEYDRVHGAGSFAALEIPSGSAARRPSAQFREVASQAKPGYADLGYWNFARLADSPLRRAGETDDQFLERMVATFKTPTLRNLAFSQPYMHNGAYHTLEDALSGLARLAEMARAGRVRAADPELARIRISEADIAPLAAFLNSLSEKLNASSVGKE